jgi:lipopolysaccharide transport system permease protein
LTPRPAGDLRRRVRRVADLVAILTPRELRLRYRENLLDVAWALITPVAVMIVYGIVLTQSFNASGSCSPYLSSAWTGLVVWTFFATALGTASWSLLTSSDLITKVYFPREALPLSVVGATLLDLGIGVVTIVIVALVQGVSLGPMAFAAIPALVLLLLWTAAACVFAAALAVFLRDVTQAVQLFLRVGFFATPVMYEPSLLPHALAWTATVNPLAVAISGVRQPVLCGVAPDWEPLLLQLVAGAVLLVLSVLYVRSVESRMADVL